MTFLIVLFKRIVLIESLDSIKIDVCVYSFAFISKFMNCKEKVFTSFYSKIYNIVKFTI